VRGLVAAVVVPVLAAALLVPLRDHISAANLALILALVVLGLAVAGGRRAGAVAGVVTAIAFDFFLTVPYESFAIDSSDDITTAAILVVVGGIGGELVERARRSQADAAARRSEVEQIHRRAELAAGGEPPARLIARTGEELTQVLGLVGARYEPGPPPPAMAVLTHRGASVPGAPSASGPETVALPVRAHGRDLGYFELVFAAPTVGMAVPVDDRHAAIAMADQLGMALLRYERPR
jgi:Domain of unknown function (DUF4118)